MPATEDGTRRLLNFFLYGMIRAAESLGNATLFVRKVTEEGLRKFLATSLTTFDASDDDARATCEAFTKAADAAGLINGSDTMFRGEGDTFSVEIGDRCPYRLMCTTRHDEGQPVHCIRSFMLAEMLRIRLDTVYDWRLNRFGRPCQITLTRSRLEKA